MPDVIRYINSIFIEAGGPALLRQTKTLGKTVKLGELRGQFIIFANRVAHHMEEPLSTDQQEII
jgi:hypothetical protein